MTREPAASRLIAVDVNRPLWRSFAYKSEQELTERHIGARVLVDFAHRQTVGIVSALLDPREVSVKGLKTARLLDPDGLIAPDVMGMLREGSAYYHYPFGQCCAAALPRILRDGRRCAYESIPGLRLTPKGEAAAPAELRSENQRQILAALRRGPCRRSQLRERGFSAAVENALARKGYVEKLDLTHKTGAWTEYLPAVTAETPPPPNSEQEYAIAVLAAARGFRTFVLNGVTGSGKTEVYLRVIEEVLRRGRAVLVLVPEIALTPQTFDRFYRRFRVPTASMHSALSDRERLDAYIDMLTGKAGILIGTRTALFTPIPRLGLIVLDEEHDSSFRQTDGFRYHARELALRRARLADCPLILGSATPSLEAFAAVSGGSFARVDLTRRAGGARSPLIRVVNLRNEPLTDGLEAGVCRTLEDRIGEETARGNQVLLFLNRRGYARNLICHACGHMFFCPGCDVPLTVHRADDTLRCHICEYRRPLPRRCDCCGGADNLLENGCGTEQVEVYLRLRYPDVAVERVDRDSVKSRADLEERLSRVRRGQSQILLGTQMIAKGHDFPNVTLAAVLDTDACLYTDDFRARERCAQLLVQVSGRAGRALKPGEVFIQTHYPEDDLIQRIADPGTKYADLAQLLLEERRQRALPPFACMAFLLAHSPGRADAHRFLLRLRAALEREFGRFPGLSLSPVLADKIEKRQNRHHFHILATSADRRTLTDFLRRVCETASPGPQRDGVRFAIEVDPLTMY